MSRFRVFPVGRQRWGARSLAFIIIIIIHTRILLSVDIHTTHHPFQSGRGGNRMASSGAGRRPWTVDQHYSLDVFFFRIRLPSYLSFFFHPLLSLQSGRWLSRMPHPPVVYLFSLLPAESRYPDSSGYKHGAAYLFVSVLTSSWTAVCIIKTISTPHGLFGLLFVFP